MKYLFIITFLQLYLIAGDQPNIIYILADDLGYGDLGCYGQEVIKTPNLDNMAEEGLRFTQHYSGSTVCAPSRSCLLLGRHTGQTYVRGNGSTQMRLDPQDLTFPRALKNAGYHTAMIGKSGLGCNTDDSTLPRAKGFDYFFGYTSHTQAHWYYPNYLWRNEQKVTYPNNSLHEGDNYSSERVIDEALEYIDRQKKGPFFLHLALQIPHASLRAKEEWKAKYRPILNEQILPVEDHPHYSFEREPKTTFAAMVSYMDYNVGLLLEKLKQLGIAENTLVMFASDNGAMEEGGHLIDSFNSNGELRGGKRDLYEGGIRVPMIAWWPGKIAAGGLTDHLSAFWDISPTLREIANAKEQQDTDGVSLVPILLGKEGQEKHSYLYWEFSLKGGKQAIRKGDWKLILLDVKKGNTFKVELYNIKDDVSETQNLASRYPEKVEQLRILIKKVRRPSEHISFRLTD
ncbi:putative exported sulfatase [Lentisphaera araneosa HTCC2155]|uniref:Putative exported sulfatase n=1 Tax=Lentisphaera araneosa HTCC2155 TaxID=313628 RepID=A6DQB7_9BACT|nr:arylsulfatase [Lentisphaera araneosa]EDM26168.1 putative exported sulfatase [Lentisphaera araneosa HTCC2155]